MAANSKQSIELNDLRPNKKKKLTQLVISRPIAPRQIKACLETPDFIENEFKQLPDIVARTGDYSSGTEHCNRYHNIQPSLESRVKLRVSGDSASAGYINANMIRGRQEAKGAYIATQGPLGHTVPDFWQMVSENGSDIIIMASDWSEGGIERSARYLPQTEGETCRYKEFEVTLEEQCDCRDYVSSIVQLKSSESDASHRVRHYRITCWPLSGLPSSTEKITTLLRPLPCSYGLGTRHIFTYRTIKSWESSRPVVVHCASGAGRTGVIIAIDIGLQNLLDKEPVIDILRTASAMKQNRSVLIQTPAQYRFINQALADVVEDLRL